MVNYFQTKCKQSFMIHSRNTKHIAAKFEKRLNGDITYSFTDWATSHPNMLETLSLDARGKRKGSSLNDNDLRDTQPDWTRLSGGRGGGDSRQHPKLL